MGSNAIFCDIVHFQGSDLYFYGLFVQIDAHAAREKITGLPREELPSVWAVLREGWYYLFAFFLLVFMLLILKREVLAPYYATPVLIIINQITSPNDRWGLKELLKFFESLGRLFAELVAILAGIGLYSRDEHTAYFKLARAIDDPGF